MAVDEDAHPRPNSTTRRPFSSYGLDSASAVSLASERRRGSAVPLSATLAWEHPNIKALAEFLAGDRTRSPQATCGGPSRRDAAEPIAIVGLGCRFPTAANPAEFWRLLRGGGDAITEVPSDRWDAGTYYDPDPDKPGKMNTRWGGFLTQIDSFDPRFFGISPREAERMDPQQRLLLEVAWEALEDASLVPAGLAGTQTGVFVGISGSDYSRLVLEDTSGADLYDGTGTSTSIAANRLSYVLDLRGPSIAIDTACSSSLVAVHACRA